MNVTITKKTLAVALLSFPVISMLSFALHFHSLSAFFRFRFYRPPYNAGPMFNALVNGRAHGFLLAHFVVLLSVPFFLIGIIILACYLRKLNAVITIAGAAAGIIGTIALAAVIGSWLSFTAVARVSPENYEGAKAALIELTKMQGALRFFTITSYFAFYGMIILAIGLLAAKRFSRWSMISIIAGSLLFVLFMDMDNWMFLGSAFLFAGFLPIAKELAGRD